MVHDNENPVESKFGHMHILTRWFPSVLLDLPPLEPVSGMRTPHRVMLQAMPSSRDVLQQLLQGSTFDLTIELDNEEAPLQRVPIEDVHEARLCPDLPLDWDLYYWLTDGLQQDLAQNSSQPGAGLSLGRTRLAVAENAFRDTLRGAKFDLPQLQHAWKCRDDFLELHKPHHGNPQEILHQYLRGLAAHLAEHATSLAFSDWVADLLQEAERNSGTPLATLSGESHKLLGLYLQHRLFGNSWLASPSGMVAGWQLLISAYALSIWFAGLLVHAGYERHMDEALFGSLWMIDQGFWRDETLLHNVLQNLNASEYTAYDLAMTLTSALQEAPIRA